MNRIQAAQLDFTDFQDMGNVICGMTSSYVDRIPADVIKRLLSRLGQCGSLSKQTMNKLVTVALSEDG